MSPESNRDHAPLTRWLSIVGIGENGVLGLGDGAKRAIASARVVFGGRRHLELASPLISGEARAWGTPFDVTMADVMALRQQPVCVLASGDPFLFGVGVTLAKLVPASEYAAFPAPSAFSLAASRLGWPLQDVEAVSLHGRPIDLIRPLLHPGRRVMALTSDGQGPAAISHLLCENGFGKSRMTVLEAIGGDKERLRTSRASEFRFDDINELNVVAIELYGTGRILPLSNGLDDDLFEHYGQITKREVRAVTLSALAPRRGELLWDIGAGSGSIGIEWMLRHPSMRAIAVERNPVRAARACRNAQTCGVPDLKVVEGTAPGVLTDLDDPDAIFIGGGGSENGLLEAAAARLKPGGRLVANAVTLEMETVLLAAHARLGGQFIRLQVSRVEPVGSMQGWKVAMPVTQWIWQKTEEQQ
jgi:precorrin-6y C5,15-methyltransferase (decarboxylating), CbiE subunit/precorrin-6Y C5,15-methyltransferase (decarboxylating), CbiT subunit